MFEGTEKSEALKSFDTGLAANFVLKNAHLRFPLHWLDIKKSDFWVFYETRQIKSGTGKDWGGGAITWLKLLGIDLHP